MISLHENKLKHVTDTIDLTVQNLPKLKKTITKSIKEEINNTWMSHIKTLLCQGHVFRLEEFELLDTTWKSYMFNLPRNTVKFLLNSVHDTLPQCYSWANHGMGYFLLITNKLEISMGHSL